LEITKVTTTHHKTPPTNQVPFFWVPNRWCFHGGKNSGKRGGVSPQSPTSGTKKNNPVWDRGAKPKKKVKPLAPPQKPPGQLKPPGLNLDPGRGVFGVFFFGAQWCPTHQKKKKKQTHPTRPPPGSLTHQTTWVGNQHTPPRGTFCCPREKETSKTRKNKTNFSVPPRLGGTKRKMWVSHRLWKNPPPPGDYFPPANKPPTKKIKKHNRPPIGTTQEKKRATTGGWGPVLGVCTAHRNGGEKKETTG